MSAPLVDLMADAVERAAASAYRRDPRLSEAQLVRAMDDALAGEETTGRPL